MGVILTTYVRPGILQVHPWELNLDTPKIALFAAENLPQTSKPMILKLPNVKVSMLNQPISSMWLVYLPTN